MRILVPRSGTRSEIWECPTSTTSLWWLPCTFLLLNVLSHPLVSHGKAKMRAWASSKQRHLRSHILRVRPVATGNHCELPAIPHTWERRIGVTYLHTPLATVLPTVSIPCIHRCSAKSADFAMPCAIAPAAFQARLVMCFA